MKRIKLEDIGNVFYDLGDPALIVSDDGVVMGKISRSLFNCDQCELCNDLWFALRRLLKPTPGIALNCKKCGKLIGS